MRYTQTILGGNIFHGSIGLDQVFLARPVPGSANYRMPIKGNSAILNGNNISILKKHYSFPWFFFQIILRHLQSLLVSIFCKGFDIWFSNEKLLSNQGYLRNIVNASKVKHVSILCSFVFSIYLK